MAEAMFVDRNPEWKYVGKPNATQHDVYRWRQGQRSPYTGQVKYHDSGDPALYARDMIRDYRSPRFFIPDDHVDATKAYLRAQGRRRDYARVRPIGATTKEIRTATREAAQFAARERYSVYTSLGAASALALAPVLVGLARGDLNFTGAAYDAGRSLTVVGAGLGTDRVLTHIRQGALRGSIRGNLVVGSAVAVTETVWILSKHGWRQALRQPEFYEEEIVEVSAIGLALAGGAMVTAIAAGAGPWAPVIIVVTSVATGAAGYVGVDVALRRITEILMPERLHQEEGDWIKQIKVDLDSEIRKTQTLCAPPKISQRLDCVSQDATRTTVPGELTSIFRTPS